MIGRKNYYGSGSVVSAQLPSQVWTITATAARAGFNPLTYLNAYLDECARAGGVTPVGEALTRFLPWAAGTEDLAAWAHDPRPNPDTTASDAHSTGNPGRASPMNTSPSGVVHIHGPDLNPIDDGLPDGLTEDGRRPARHAARA